MKDKITIAVDAMGGENSPNKNIKGISLFLEKYKKVNNLLIYLYGDEDLIKKELILNEVDQNKIKIFHTTSVVPDDQTPLTAVKNSK